MKTPRTVNRPDFIVNIGSMIISAMLLATFFFLLNIGVIEPSSVMTSMILLVISVTCLAIYSSVYRIECELRERK